MTERIARFLAENRPETPCLVVALDVIAEAYDVFRWYLPLARVYYAVKATPAPQIVAMLERKGANFDVASRGEIELCLANGIAADRLSFGNTVKKEKDIAFAYHSGLRLFGFDGAVACSPSTALPSSTSWRVQHPPRRCSAASSSLARVPSGRCRVSLAVA